MGVTTPPAIIVPEYMKGWDMLKRVGAFAVRDFTTVIHDPLRAYTMSAALAGPTLAEAVTLVRYATTVGVPLVWETLPLLSDATLNARLGMAHAMLLRDAIDEKSGYENLLQVIRRGPDAVDLRDLRPVRWARVEPGGHDEYTVRVMDTMWARMTVQGLVREGRLTVYGGAPEDVEFQLRTHPFLSTLEL